MNRLSEEYRKEIMHQTNLAFAASDEWIEPLHFFSCTAGLDGRRRPVHAAKKWRKSSKLLCS
ncbi:MAG: hypothetical protein QM743_01495 [Chitinophagaceae bacterium]